MQITVHDNTKLQSVQEDFSGAYRYLKLEFPSLRNASPERLKPGGLNGSTVSDVSKKTNDRSLTITPTMTIKNLKQQFLECYGLPVNVMRRFGKTWVETTVTDNWTLEEQNRHGERLSDIGKV